MQEELYRTVFEEVCEIMRQILSYAERNHMIKGIHHISMKCKVEELERVKDFYINVLEMSVCREWDDGLMIDCGNR